MQYLIAAIIGYLFGCSSMAFYISKIKKVDIKGQGSKNYGASNTTLLIGKKAGLIVLVHDIMKAVVPVVVCRILFADSAGAIAGAAAVFGHIFPFYLKFNGGKGFASFIGAAIAMSPFYAIAAIVVALILAAIFDYIVVATFTYAIAMPAVFFFTSDWITTFAFLLCTVVIFIKHKSNIVNLVTQNGKEAKLRSTLLKKNK